MKKLESFSPNEIVILSALLGILVSQNLNVNQQNVVGNFLETLGQNILVVNAQIQNLQSQQVSKSNQNTNNKNKSKNKRKNTSSTSTKELQKQIDELKEYIKKLEDKIDG